MNNDLNCYEMSIKTEILEKNDNNIRILENIQHHTSENNGFTSTDQFSNINPINTFEVKNNDYPSTSNNCELTPAVEEGTESKQPVKQCVVVLQRSQTVEAAWQREQLRRQARLSSPTSSSTSSTTSKPGITTKEGHPSKKRPILPTCVERSDAGFICQLCGNTYPGRTSFMQHIRSEHSSTCDVCAKVLSSTQKLKDHLRFVHGKSQTSWEQKLFTSTVKYSCTFCHKIFGSQSLLDKHTIFKHSSMDLESSQSQSQTEEENLENCSYKCEFCSDEYNTKLKLREHIFEKHIDEEDSEPSSSSCTNIKEDKIVEPTGPPVTAYECPHCLTLHANKDRFKKHLGFKWPESFSEHQVKIDPHVLARQKEAVSCEVCGARAANLAFLHTHQSSHPELDRPYNCPNPCNRKFLFRCQLDRHALIHQVGAPVKTKHEVKPPSSGPQCGRHRCNVCSKRTRSEARLQAHVACCHKGNVEYRCKVCDICFPSAKSLGRHCNKKEHLSNMEENHEPWVSPETPSVNLLTQHTQSVRPDSLGSSDSVSTSDAFSMYFQSLHSLGSLDMALDIGNNQSIFENVDDVLPTRSFSTETNVILHGRPGITEVTEINAADNTEVGNELQFHTLQTVPVEPLSELEATYLQNMKVEPLSQTSSSNMDVQQVENNELFNDKSEPMETENTTFLQNIPETVVPKLESTNTLSNVSVQENTNTELSQLESFLILQQNQYPINIDDICSVNEKSINDLPAPPPPILQIPQPLPTIANTITPITIIQTKKIKLELNEIKIEPEVIKTELKVNNEEITNIQPNNKCDLIKTKITATNETTDEVIKFLPDLNDSECNIQLLADTCDSSTSLSDLGNSSSLSNDSNKNKILYKKQISNCSDCGKIFSSAHSAARHAKLSCPGRDPKSLQVSCPQCDLLLPDRKELHKHKREIHPDTLFTCSACSKTFFLAQSLARHQKESCSHRETFPCRQCKLLLSSVEDLRSHTADKHPGILATCEICGKTLSSAQSLRRHLRSHKPDELEQKDDTGNKIKSKKNNVKSNVEGGDDDTFDIIKTDDTSKDEQSQVSSLADDLLSDFASISTNQLFNGNLSNGNELQEEFNISDMFLIKNGALQCDFCEASFLSDKLLLQHLSSQHFPNTQWQPAQPPPTTPTTPTPTSTSSVVASTSTQNNTYDLPSTSY